jgi:type II secretory pathway component GspD/PulD (secretin)
LLTPSLLLTLCCLLFSAQLIAATAFKIITLQHHFAEDILPAIQPLVGSEGVVTGMQNQLIIRTSPEKMAEIEQIVATLDVARQNLKITVSRHNSLQTEHEDVTVNGRKRVGNVDIGANKYVNDSVQIDLENNQNNSRSSNQFIDVVDGERAFIRVGQSVPFTQEWVTMTRQYINAPDVRVQQSTKFVDIATGFAVRPRSIGNQVELEITPRIAQLNQSGFIDFEELSTVVHVNRGEWLDLGGLMQQKDDVSRAILSKQSSNQLQSNQLSIRVE